MVPSVYDSVPPPCGMATYVAPKTPEYRIVCISDNYVPGQVFYINLVAEPGTFDYKNKTGFNVRPYCCVMFSEQTLRSEGHAQPFDKQMHDRCSPENRVTCMDLVTRYGANIRVACIEADGSITCKGNTEADTKLHYICLNIKYGTVKPGTDFKLYEDCQGFLQAEPF